VSDLIDIDLGGYEPEEEPENCGARRGRRTPPHPPGPVGLYVPRTRLWIKRPPGPAGL
jgi:hypothetical protein